MSDLVKCPHCSKDIENDSFYCDQCGAELMYCPKCHIFGKGKFCSKCRTPLVPASKGASSQPVASNTANGTPASSNSAVPNQQPPVVTGGNMSQSTSKPSAQPGMQSTLRDNVVATRLVCRSAGITLMLKDGAIMAVVMANMRSCLVINLMYRELMPVLQPRLKDGLLPTWGLPMVQLSMAIAYRQMSQLLSLLEIKSV